MNELLELINSVKATSKYNDVVLFGNKQSFDKLIDSGFPLRDFQYREVTLDESKIMIIPCEPKSIKLYFDCD